MLIHNRVVITVLGLTLALVGAQPIGQGQNTAAPIEGIRKELMQLPYYGVFDFLAFSYDKGTVNLAGYAYRPTLKADAERAIKRVTGVDTVKNDVEILPVSPNDDELRWKTYFAIYGDPFLSKYSPGGGALWGHRHPFGPGFHRLGPFSGMEPAGDYPIRIIVKGGRIKLLGVVDNESDKTVAGLRAREVPGAFAVENELVVEKSTD